MNRFLTFCLVSLSGLLQLRAEDFDISGTTISVPAPKGFVKVSKEMGLVYRYCQQMHDPVNDTLATYISEADAAKAFKGEIPDVKKYFILKVNKKLKEIPIAPKDFAELKTITKNSNQVTIDTLKNELGEAFDVTKNQVKKEFDLDVAFDVSKVIPLPAHYETDQAIAFSMFANLDMNVEGKTQELHLAVTSAFLLKSGKVLFLYNYAPIDDLEWTRQTSQAWVESFVGKPN